MTRERFRFGAVVFGLFGQIVGGVLLFGLAPEVVFADIGSDSLAQQCLRLAVFSNVGMALVVVLVLRYAPQPRLLRWVAAGGAVYHALAGVDGLRAALGLTGVNLVEPIFGPAIAHSLTFLVLVVAALMPTQESVKVVQPGL